MRRENVRVKHEIQLTREKLNHYIDRDGISDDPNLVSINNRLDELILQWMHEKNNF